MKNYTIIYSFNGQTKWYGPVRAANPADARNIFERLFSGNYMRVIDVFV